MLTFSSSLLETTDFHKSIESSKRLTLGSSANVWSKAEMGARKIIALTISRMIIQEHLIGQTIYNDSPSSKYGAHACRCGLAPPTSYIRHSTSFFPVGPPALILNDCSMTPSVFSLARRTSSSVGIYYNIKLKCATAGLLLETYL